jgi:hypothetical protein
MSTYARGLKVVVEVEPLEIDEGNTDLPFRLIKRSLR